jgi:hypothetical protein
VLLRKIKRDRQRGVDTANCAKEIFNNLKMMSMTFLDIYFRTATIRFRA